MEWYTEQKKALNRGTIMAKKTSSDNEISKNNSSPKNEGNSKSLWRAYFRRKKVTIPLTILILVGILSVIPYTRYALLGPFVMNSVVVEVLDSQTKTPVSEANVEIDGQTVATNSDGVATLKSHVGYKQVVVSKQYYGSSTDNIEVPLFGEKRKVEVSLKATGRVTSVHVTDKISGASVKNLTIDAGKENTARTDDKGVATIVIPADQDSVEATISGGAYLTAKVTIYQKKPNELAVVPNGTIYFLSKQSGKIDVVSTNFDGSERKVIVPGTGNEDDRTTALLASRDWKYLVLHAKRDKDDALYLVDTATNKYELIDQGKDIHFELIGWSDHSFLYKLTRESYKDWQAGREVLKSYNAPARNLSVIDSVEAGKKESYSGAYDSTQQYLSSFYILKDNQIVYIKEWAGDEWRLGKNKMTVIASINADGSGKQILKSYNTTKISYIEAKLYTPQNIHYRVWDKNYKRLENVQTVNGAITPVPASQQKFDQSYPTFLISPDGQESFWAESRDGKNALFIGDNNATGGTIKQLANLSEYTAYGWMTDKYLLLQKDNSELYITTPTQLKNSVPPLKISDYHKPSQSFAGYGYGYGGQ